MFRTLKIGEVRMLQQNNSQYVQWFSEIEHELALLFKLFSPLCEMCFSTTLEQEKTHCRKKRQSWCCCLIDNQVRDNWKPLDFIQKRNDTNWYQKITDKNADIKKGRMPGNGPCPALGKSGCLIKKCRPITCSTQVCEKMLNVLDKTGIFSNNATFALQIEDIIDVPDILPELYGLKNRKRIMEKCELFVCLKTS